MSAIPPIKAISYEPVYIDIPGGHSAAFRRLQKKDANEDVASIDLVHSVPGQVVWIDPLQPSYIPIGKACAKELRLHRKAMLRFIGQFEARMGHALEGGWSKAEKIPMLPKRAVTRDEDLLAIAASSFLLSVEVPVAKNVPNIDIVSEVLHTGLNVLKKQIRWQYAQILIDVDPAAAQELEDGEL